MRQLFYKKRTWVVVGVAVLVAVLVTRGYQLWTIGQQAFYHAYYSLQQDATSSGNGSRVDTVTFNSEALGKKMTYAVYVPAGYASSTNEHYPVLYLLHGDPGNFRDWVVNANLAKQLNILIAEKKIPPLLVVCPDGNSGPVAATEYVNATRFNQNMEDYILNDVRQDVESRYRTINDRSGRAIGGNSSGGFGAANIAFRHSNLYSVTLIFGGYYENWHNELKGVFGNNQTAIDSNSPMLYLKHNSITEPFAVYMTLGKYDWGSLVEENKKFDALLAQEHVQHELVITSGTHNWNRWNQSLPDALIYLKQHLPVWNR